MKTIRSLMRLAGLSLMLFALGATGAKAQSLARTDVAGTFTLPNDAQWGSMALPAGHYKLYYGKLFGSYFVEVRGTENGSPHGMVRVIVTGQSSAAKNELICVREGDTLIIRALDMPLIDTAAEFAMPRGAQVTAHNGKHNGYTQLAEAPMLIQRVPIAMNSK